MHLQLQVHTPYNDLQNVIEIQAAEGDTTLRSVYLMRLYIIECLKQKV